MLLSLIIALAIIAGTAVLLARGIKAARASKQHMVVMVFGLAVVVALAAGVWFGIFHEFQLSDRVRIQGAPVPLVIFILEGQNWTDFVKPLPVGYVCMVANALFPVGLLSLLCMLIFKRKGVSQ